MYHVYVHFSVWSSITLFLITYNLEYFCSLMCVHFCSGRLMRCYTDEKKIYDDRCDVTSTSFVFSGSEAHSLLLPVARTFPVSLSFSSIKKSPKMLCGFIVFTLLGLVKSQGTRWNTWICLSLLFLSLFTLRYFYFLELCSLVSILSLFLFFFFMFVKVCNDTLSLSHRLLGDKRFLRWYQDE